MKILWFPRLQFDIDKLHITTWRKMSDELESRGHTVKLAIAGKYQPNLYDKPYIPIPILRKKFFRILSFWLLGYFQFYIQLFKFKPKAIILDLYTIFFSFPLALIPKRYRPVLIMDNRTPYFSKDSDGLSLQDYLMKLFTGAAFLYSKYFLNGATVITDHYRKSISLEYKYSLENIGVWGSGVDLDVFSPEKSNAFERPEELKSKFILFQHGEISYNRGLFEVIQAIAKCNLRDVCLVIVGATVGESNAKKDLEKLAKKLSLENQVFIYPPVRLAEVPKYISWADVAVMAYPKIDYWNNNNPIKLAEYLSMGKPIICTDMWTFRDVMGDSSCGVYLENNSPETISKAINFCYNNKIKLIEFGREGISIAAERFTWKSQALNLEKFLNKAGKL